MSGMYIPETRLILIVVSLRGYFVLARIGIFQSKYQNDRYFVCGFKTILSDEFGKNHIGQISRNLKRVGRTKNHGYFLSLVINICERDA